MKSETKDRLVTAFITIIVLASILGLIIFALWGLPKWGVYRANLAGQAALQEAESARRITVVQAEAERDAATMQKQRDIIRAEGIAASNKIIANSITPQYIEWLWVEALKDTKNQVIYVPTEANLPLLEAMRLKFPVEGK